MLCYNILMDYYCWKCLWLYIEDRFFTTIFVYGYNDSKTIRISSNLVVFWVHCSEFSWKIYNFLKSGLCLIIHLLENNSGILNDKSSKAAWFQSRLKNDLISSFSLHPFVTNENKRASVNNSFRDLLLI